MLHENRLSAGCLGAVVSAVFPPLQLDGNQSIQTTVGDVQEKWEIGQRGGS